MTTALLEGAQIVDQLDAELGQTQAARVEAELPGKYKGKTAEEIAAMHAEAEKLIGRQGAELGELRRLTDSILKQTLQREATASGTAAPNTKPQSEVDFFADPKKAVQEAIENSPVVKGLVSEAEMQRRRMAHGRLIEKHPDAQQLAATEDFQKWVMASPVRTKMYAQADQGFDFDTASELLDTFKALHPTKPAEGAQGEGEVKPTAERKPSTGSSLPRGTVGTDPSEGTKKIYRRADLIRLKIEDPKRYMELQPEIMAAYQENRVR